MGFGFPAETTFCVLVMATLACAPRSYEEQSPGADDTEEEILPSRKKDRLSNLEPLAETENEPSKDEEARITGLDESNPRVMVTVHGAENFGRLSLIQRPPCPLDPSRFQSAAQRVFLLLFQGGKAPAWATMLAFDLRISVTRFDLQEEMKGESKLGVDDYELVAGDQIIDRLHPGEEEKWVRIYSRGEGCPMRIYAEPSLAVVAEVALQVDSRSPPPKTLDGEIVLVEEAAEEAAEELERRAVDLAREVSYRLGQLATLGENTGVALAIPLPHWIEEMNVVAARDDLLDGTAAFIRGDTFAAIRSFSQTSEAEEGASMTRLLALARSDAEKQKLMHVLEAWDLLDEDIQVFLALRDGSRLSRGKAKAA